MPISAIPFGNSIDGNIAAWITFEMWRASFCLFFSRNFTPKKAKKRTQEIYSAHNLRACIHVPFQCCGCTLEGARGGLSLSTGDNSVNSYLFKWYSLSHYWNIKCRLFAPNEMGKICLLHLIHFVFPLLLFILSHIIPSSSCLQPTRALIILTAAIVVVVHETFFAWR